MKSYLTIRKNSSREYRVGFIHNRENTGSKNPSTVCIIRYGKPGTLTKDMTTVSIEYAYRMATDQFCRRIGRDIAFTKAIEKLPKEDRKLIWSYFIPKNRPYLVKKM